MSEQQDLQKQWREELDISQKEADSSYQFMKWCDRLSLILCQGQLPSNERALEINIGPDGQKYHIVQSSNGDISVFPWCFTEDKFTVFVETSYLSQIEFKDNEEITEALKNAPREYKEWTLTSKQHKS